MAFPWTCPFCDRDTTITAAYSEDSFILSFNNSVGYRYFKAKLIVCPNESCRKFTLSLSMFEYAPNTSRQYAIGKCLQIWELIPPSTAKVFPDYVPKVIRDDYLEACLIRTLSPKASATLSRRCLQGIISDFWES